MNANVTASIWQRFLGVFYDGLLMSPVYAAYSLIALFIPSMSNNIYLGGLLISPIFWIITILYYFYYIYLTGEYGRTIGKLIAGTKVVRHSGENVDFKISAMRYLPLAIFSNIVIFIPSIGLTLVYVAGLCDSLALFFNKDRRTLHDFIAGTKVVKDDSRDLGFINKKMATMLMLFLFVCAISINVATVQVKEYINNNPLSAKWEQLNLGNSGMTIYTPFMLNQGKMSLPSNIKPYVEKAETYSYTNSETSFDVNASYIKYDDSIKCDLIGGVKGSINAMKNAAGVRNFTFNKQPRIVNGKSGIYVKANYLYGDIEHAAKGIYVVSNSKFWMLIITYPMIRDEYEQVSNKILQSFVIK